MSATAPVLALLARQGDALRTGDVAALPGIAAELERALAQLPPAIPTHELARLRKVAAQAARLLAAAQAGLAQARAILDTWASGNGALGTYDAAGRSAALIPQQGRTLARR